jgi:hypothetical protein
VYASPPITADDNPIKAGMVEENSNPGLIIRSEPVRARNTEII